MDRIQIMNLVAYSIIAVVIVLTALTAWAIIKDDKAGQNKEDKE